ncbi:MAG: FAD-dependent oxidoreductase [Candidatus Omnitrophota bacterium]|nr:FAD-dependent oxidoreductase [Candidatus Omnitrophota bacterium]
MKYAIIGASAAGAQAAEELRKLDKESKITVISQEKYLPYSRCLLSRFVDGRLTENGLYFKTQHFFKDYDIEGVLGARVIAIDKTAKKIIAQDKREFAYDKLLLATGSSPRLPKIEGLGLNGVYSFHSLGDAYKVNEKIKDSKTAVVVGAGFVGLEAAYALVKRGLKVTVIEKCSQALPNQMDITASRIIQKDLEELGVEIILDESLISIEGNQEVDNVITADKSRIQCDLVIIATGMTPNKELADQIQIDRGRGILVDEFLTTSEKDIYAAGDVIEIQDISTGKRAVSATWLNAVLQGKFAAYNMAGLRKRFTQAVGIQNAVQFHQIPAISFGKTLIESEEDQQEYEVISIHNDKAYKKLVLKSDKICGMIFVGDIAKSGFYTALIRHEIDVSKYKDKLLDSDFNCAYFKEENFGQQSPYAEIAGCWDSPDWWAHRAMCIGIKS